jgi:hypothetical protein
VQQLQTDRGFNIPTATLAIAGVSMAVLSPRSARPVSTAKDARSPAVIRRDPKGGRGRPRPRFGDGGAAAAPRAACRDRDDRARLQERQA